MKNGTRQIITKLKHPRGSNENEGEVYIALPSNYSKGDSSPLLIALHGSGREAMSYRDVPFYVIQRDIALECGYVFASVSNGSDTYGLDDGYENIKMLYEYMIKNYNTSKEIALWASSAGGFMMHRFYRENKQICKLLLGVFTGFNPFSMPPLESMLKAFKAKDTTDIKSKFPYLDPELFSKEIYRGTKIVISHGVDDSAVPITQSKELEKQVLNYGGEMILIEKIGGHSIENYGLYETNYFKDALIDFKSTLRKSCCE